MDKPYQATSDIVVLPSHFPVPGMGLLPINAFVIKGTEPVLVDTGIGKDSEEFISTLESVIDPRDLRWIWITHDDADHTGNIQKILNVATNARLVANAIAILRMSTAWQVPMDRVYWLNPEESISAGDHKLTAVRPILFDNPSTIGIYDHKLGTLFSVDSFGAFLSAPVQDADNIKGSDLTKGMTIWTKADNPWIHMLEPNKFSQRFDNIRQMNPKLILSSHLPPARRKTEQFLETLADIPASEPWVAPNQAALEQILAQMRGGR